MAGPNAPLLKLGIKWFSGKASSQHSFLRYRL